VDRLEDKASPTMNECYFCKGPVKADHITHIHRWGEQIIILEDVPADVCQQCGEVYFAPDVLKTLDRLTEGKLKERPKKELRVPVYSFSECER